MISKKAEINTRNDIAPQYLNSDILNENKNMYEVSTIVGFKHQASFTHAFKKYYGLLPSEISR